MKELFDNMPDGVSIIDSDMRIEWVNKVLHNKGFHCEGVRGQKCYVVYKQKNKICKHCPALKAFYSGKTIRVHERGADGKHYEVTAIPIKIDGKTEKVVEIVREMRKQKSFAVSLGTSGKILAFVVDSAGVLVAMNNYAQAVLGYNEKEVAKTNFIRLLQKKDAKEFNKTLQEIIEGKKFPSFRTEMRTKKGRIIPVEINCSPFFSNGDVLGVEVVAKDITDISTAEKELKDSEGMLKGLMSAMDDMVFGFDSEARFTFFNSPSPKDLYVEPKNFIGKRYDEVMPKHTLKDFKKAFAANKKGKSAEYEYWLDIGGKRRWFFVKISPVTENSRFAGCVAVVRDITQRKNAEHGLHTSEEKYRELFEAAHDAIFLHDLKGNIIDVNKSAVKLFGYSGHGFTALNIRDIHPKSALETSKKAFEQVSKKGSVNFEVEFRKKNGSIFQGDVSASTFNTGGGQLVQGVVRDVSWKKQEQAELKKAKEKAEKYLNLAGTMIVAIDSSGKITMINKKGCEILGCTDKKIIGKNWFDSFIPKRMKKNAKSVFNKCMKGKLELVEHYENAVLSRDGSERIVRWHNTLIKDDEGSIIGTLSSGEDITERLVARESIHESKRKYRAIFELSPEAIVMIDKEGTITDVNGKVCEWAGCKTKDLIGKNIAKLPFLGSVSRALVERNFALRMKGKDVNPYEIKFTGKRGKKGYARVNATVLNDSMGKPAGVIAVISDITEMVESIEKMKKKCGLE